MAEKQVEKVEQQAQVPAVQVWELAFSKAIDDLTSIHFRQGSRKLG